MNRKLLFIILFWTIIVKTNAVKAQELWQLQPWAADSTYIIGAFNSGEPTWVQINGIATKIDSVKYMSDTLYMYTPDTIFKAEIIGGTGGGVGGSGATNKVAYWKTSDTLTYDTAFHFTPSTKILGIGTTSPFALGSGIHIHGSNFSTLNLTNNTTGKTSGNGSGIYTVGDSLYIANRENAKIDIGTNNATRMTITGTGRVGINNSNPATTFAVGGDATFSSLASGASAPSTTGTLVKVVSDANGKLSFQTNNTGTVTSVGLTTGTSGTDVGVSNSPVTGSGTITLNIPTASATNTGKLSNTDWSTFNNKIGSLNGLSNSTQSFSVTNSTSGFTINSSGGTHTFNLPYEENSTSFRLGHQSVRRDNSVSLGNNAMGSSGASANNNTAIGKDVLRLAGSTGSGGTNNVGIGFQSLYSNTTGLNNTCISNYSGYNITSGTNNTAIGNLSGFTLSTQSNNTFIGYEAGRQNTGSGGVFIGNQAGRNETNSNRLYIENSDGSTPLIGGDFNTNVVGINTDFGSIARTLTVTGEMRVTDLVTDNPIKIIGADAEGDFSEITAGSGLTLTGSSLTANDVSNTNERITSVVSMGTFGTGNTIVILEAGNSFTGIIPAMTGATNTVAGKQGVVPPPAAGSQNRFLRGDGTWVDNANGTVTSILTDNGITGGTITTTGTIGLTGQALALHNASSNGLFARTGAGTVANRTITGGDGITVTNGNGVSGNPTITNNTSHYAQLYNNGSASVTSNASLSLLSSANYATLTYTSNGSFSNPSTNRIRCDFTGTVKIMIDATWQGGNGTSTNHNLIVYKNGSSTPTLPSIDANNVALSGTNREQHTYRNGIIVDVSTNDYFEFYYTAPASTTLVLPLMTIQRIN